MIGKLVNVILFLVLDPILFFRLPVQTDGEHGMGKDGTTSI
jgi:hypothetical protein